MTMNSGPSPPSRICTGSYVRSILCFRRDGKYHGSIDRRRLRRLMNMTKNAVIPRTHSPAITKAAVTPGEVGDEEAGAAEGVPVLFDGGVDIDDDEERQEVSSVRRTISGLELPPILPNESTTEKTMDVPAVMLQFQSKASPCKGL